MDDNIWVIQAIEIITTVEENIKRAQNEKTLEDALLRLNGSLLDLGILKGLFEDGQLKGR